MSVKNLKFDKDQIKKILELAKNNKLLVLGGSIIATGIALIIRKLFYKASHYIYKYPPCLTGIPSFGALFKFGIYPKETLYTLGTLGPVSMMQIGTNYHVYINNPKLVKQLFTDKRMFNRPPLPANYETMSVADSSGPNWKIRRKYAMKSLITLTKSNFVAKKVNETIEYYVGNKLDNIIKNNKLWYPSDHLCLFSFNNVYSSMFGKVIKNFNDEFITKFIKYNEKWIQGLILYELLGMIPPFGLPEFIKSKFSNLKAIEDELLSLVTNEIKKNGYNINVKNNTIEYEGKDFDDINEDIYAQYVTKQHKAGKMKSVEIVWDVFTLLAAGVDTTQNSGEYGFIILALNKDIQDKLYNELINIFPDKIYKPDKLLKLHYFRAFIYEMLRTGSVVSGAGIPHYINKSIQVKFNNKEYILPKGAYVNINHYYIQNFSECWTTKNEDTKNLYKKSINLDLNNFMNNGQFKMNDNFVVFGKGRDCLGQSLAFKALYAIFAVMILKYEFIWPENQEKILKIKFGGTDTIFPKVGIKVVERQ